MTDLSLFPDLQPPPPAEAMSAGRRLTERQRAAVAAGIHPLTRTKARPDLGTCGSCALRGHNHRDFPKCCLGHDPEHGKTGPYMTHGPATDCRAWWPACDHHQPKETQQ